MILKVYPISNSKLLNTTKDDKSTESKRVKSRGFCRFSQCLICKKVSNCNMTSDECEDSSGRCLYFEE